jgi:hypothetical protein
VSSGPVAGEAFMRWLALLVLLPMAPIQPVRAQVPLFVSGLAGGAFTTDDDAPSGAGGGFAFQVDVGLRLRRVAVGGELGQHSTARNLKAKLFGGFVRLPSLASGPVRLYFVAGLGAYRLSPSGGGTSTTVGGSLGPGVAIALQNTRLGILLEVRFHATFDHLPRLNRQQFIAALGGLELRL